MNHSVPESDDSEAKDNLFVKPQLPLYRRYGLIIVDVQNDFISGTMSLDRFGGENAKKIVPIINHLLDNIQFNVVVYSRDWHPPDHVSFLTSPNSYVDDNSKGHKWPDHCVAGTWGADFAPDLQLKPNAEIILHVNKGTEINKDTYSAFEGSISSDSLSNLSVIPVKNRNNLYTLKDVFKNLSLDVLFVCGLVAEYCVLETCLSAKNESIPTYVLMDAICGIQPFNESITNYKQAGILLSTTKMLIDSFKKQQSDENST